MLATIIVHWQRLLYIFNISGVFVNVNRDNVSQILVGPALHTKPHLIWSNVVRALLAEVWFKINQHVFHDIFSDWMVPFEVACLASSWCCQAKAFADFSIQDLCLNWRVFASIGELLCYRLMLLALGILLFVLVLTFSSCCFRYSF